jgi:hypothetical protein
MASCKTCNYIAHNEWLRKNPEKAKEYGRRARSKSKDKQALRRLKWIKLNPERHAQSQRESRLRIYRENLSENKEKRRIETAELSDRYIAKIMRLPLRLLPRELIDAKRVQLLIYRHMKEIK